MDEAFSGLVGRGYLQGWELDERSGCALSPSPGAKSVKSSVQLFEHIFHTGEVSAAGFSLRDLLMYEDEEEVFQFLVGEGVQPCIAPGEAYRASDAPSTQHYFAMPFLYPVKGRPFCEDEGGVDVSAFNTHDFEREAGEFDRVAYAKKKAVERAREIACLYNASSSEEGKELERIRFKAFVNNLCVAKAEQYEEEMNTTTSVEWKEECSKRIQSYEDQARRLWREWEKLTNKEERGNPSGAGLASGPRLETAVVSC